MELSNPIGDEEVADLAAKGAVGPGQSGNAAAIVPQLNARSGS
jgi:hypothetical protein